MNGFRLSTDDITYIETPIEPFVEFSFSEESRRRGDQQMSELGLPHMRWYFGDQPVLGTDFYWFAAWVTGASTTVYVRTKTGEVASNGTPVYREYEAVMGRVRGEIDTENEGGQQFVDVEIEFWDMLEV